MTVRDFIFFDIETVGKQKDLKNLELNEPKLYQMITKKFGNRSEKKDTDSVEEFYRRMSPVLPEFGKIVCISYGYVDSNDNWKVNSCVGDEEYIVKNAQKTFQKALDMNLQPCGYNIIGFDMPWLNKKMVKYGLQVPYNILLYNKKPWEVKVLDLCDVWKSTGRYWCSLDEVIYELGLPSPKDELSGDKVHDTFWVENDITKISKYCEKDVKATKDIVEKLIVSYF